MQVAPMSLADLELALEWAAEEGWNPGLDDAAAFLAADPGGFLMGRVGGEPVACISMVRHSPGFAFLGLYLCRPEWRGRGYGWSVWQAGLELAGTRTIGLDGVVAQQENYRRSGFSAAGRTVRFAGAPAAAPDAGLRSCAGLEAEIARLDRAATGVQRPRFLAAWLADTATRRSLCLAADGELEGFGTVRCCREGLKIGPVIATSQEAAHRLVAALAGLFPGRPVVLDVPERNAAAMELAGGLGLAPVFETARMYRGTPPEASPHLTWGVGTLELG